MTEAAAISSGKIRTARKITAVNAHDLEAKSLWQKAKFYLLAATLTLAVLLVGFAVYTVFSYFHYSRIVEQRLADGFWETRSGIYAAPRVLRVGQKVSPDELAALLRRTGYVENAAAGIWSGNFSVNEKAVLINHGTAFQTVPAVAVSFGRDGRIAKIQEQGGAVLDKFAIKPELLTDESGAKSASRQTLDYKDLPKPLVNAILAIEDRRFYDHAGIDAKGSLRALWTNISGGETRQGGSTITQQLVKNTFLTPARTFERKFAEGLIAVALERRLSKEAILALYCNEIYLGQRGAVTINGVEQAARVYFGKSVAELNLSESAAIAAMIKSPRRFSPDAHREAFVSRRNLVLDLMAQNKFISQAEADEAKNAEIALAPVSEQKPLGANFVDSVRGRIETDNNMNGWRVQTTIDPQLQEFARVAVSRQMEKLSQRFKDKKLQAALVAIDAKTGNVVAMVGGRDYAVSQLNRTTDTFRQPGSVFKPVVYAAALESGKTPMSRYMDAETEFVYAGGQKYKPKNYGGKFSGKNVTLKTALVKSLNTVTVGLAMETGLQRTAQFARDFGLPVKEVYPSLALGTEEASPLDIASAYTAFANGGVRVAPNFIAEITGGNGGKIYEGSPDKIKVTSPETAYMITDMLTGVVTNGTASSAKGALGKHIFAGKTGTSNDGWFVGYTPNLVCAVWVGFDENKDLNLTGADSALPVWADFMRATIEARPELGGHQFPMPATLTTVTIDPETGMLADATCPASEKVVVAKQVAPNMKCFQHDHRVTSASDYDFSNLTATATPLETTNAPAEATSISVPVAPNQREIRSGAPAGIKIVEISKSKPQTRRTKSSNPNEMPDEY